MSAVQRDSQDSTLSRMVQVGYLDRSDLYAARTIASALSSDPRPIETLSVAVALRATQLGHVFVDLQRPAEILRTRTGDAGRVSVEVDGSADDEIWPTPAEWLETLERSSFVHRARSWDEWADGTSPLVLFGSRLYTARQWNDEKTVADVLGERLEQEPSTIDEGVVERLFPNASPNDRQAEAVRTSLRHRTSILLGGPGTGKTYTIARILSAHLSVHGEESRIALAAPTAKAATQMRESLLQSISGSDHPFLVTHGEIFRALEATTIHRLLGRKARQQTRFAHDARHPLEVDLLVIDEMSMVSLPLMARLVEALPPSTHLVLVGDPGQLASVENGSILPDLDALADRLGDRMTTLEVSRRNARNASSDLATVIRQADIAEAMRLVQAPPDSTLGFIATDTGIRGAKTQIGEMLEVFAKVKMLAMEGRSDEALGEASRLRIVCAHRHGDWGVESWNRHVLATLFEDDVVWNPGNIVIKTRNDVANGLSNGDTGVIVASDRGPRVVFRHGPDIVSRPMAAMDDVEMAFATTVHKAQGSEFETVVVVVPPSTSPLCNRELLYTAVTRAKPQVVLVGSIEDVSSAIATQRPRCSGLADRLRSRH